MIHRPKLKKLTDYIYCLQFTNPYDLSMTFLRYQEFYESPKYRGKYFQIADFMEWYSKKYGDGAFTYPVDYVGFNLPSHAIVPVIRELKQHKYDQWTQYDQIMYETVLTIKEEIPYASKFYLIGVMEGDTPVLKHELAHALFTINHDYQRKMGHLVNELPKKDWKTMTRALKTRGYGPNVFDDEAQAYLSTGLHDLMKTKGLKKASKKFRAILRPYLDKIL